MRVQKSKKKRTPTGKRKRGKGATDEALPGDRFLNRELTWLAFNERVLEQAADETLPILERAKFLAITSSNLDEFMMVRVGGLKILKQRNPSLLDPAGMVPVEQLQAVATRGHEIVARQYRLLGEEVLPQLESAGIAHVDLDQTTAPEHAAANARFWRDVFPVLSPQAVSSDSFPMLQGLGMNLLVRLKRDPQARLGTATVGEATGEDGGEVEHEYALIPMGRALPRVIHVSGDKRHGYVLLENLATHFVDAFFPGRQVVECVAFRLTRNADIELREDEASDLLGGMEEMLESRRFSRPVRLEYVASASDGAVRVLTDGPSIASGGPVRDRRSDWI